MTKHFWSGVSLLFNAGEWWAFFDVLSIETAATYVFPLGLLCLVATANTAALFALEAARAAVGDE